MPSDARKFRRKHALCRQSGDEYSRTATTPTSDTINDVINWEPNAQGKLGGMVVT